MLHTFKPDFLLYLNSKFKPIDNVFINFKDFYMNK